MVDFPAIHAGRFFYLQNNSQAFVVVVVRINCATFVSLPVEAILTTIAIGEGGKAKEGQAIQT